MKNNISAIEDLASILPAYDLVMCDVWGVLHNGVAAWSEAISALQAARANGACVVMVTNAPRPAAQVRSYMQRLNVPDDICDAIISSGDVTRQLIEDAKCVAHLGPDKDDNLYDGLSAKRTSDLVEAQAIVCTGLMDDVNEHPTDYHDQMKHWLENGLPMICANPDIVVEVGGRLAWCAGALAREYEKLGGVVEMAGKPHRPIYEQGVALAESVSSRNIDQRRIIAIGDGQPTDVTGANAFDVDLLFISNGIHVHEYGERDRPDLEAVSKFLEDNGNHAKYMMPSLK